jgi:hypothetical protein
MSGDESESHSTWVRRAYSTPQLIVFGDVKSLTAGGSGTCLENDLENPSCGDYDEDPFD